MNEMFRIYEAAQAQITKSTKDTKPSLNKMTA